MLSGSEFDVCAEADTSDEAVDAVRRHYPDVCLLDVYMPGGGIRAARAIHEEFPEIAIVMLTVSDDDADLLAAIRAGACGFLLKDADPVRLPEALKGIVAGHAALPRNLMHHLIDEGHDRDRRSSLLKRKGVKLTGREAEVLGLMSRGLTTSEMAERLFVSQVTVRTHVSALLRKLGVTDRQSAVRLIEAEGTG